MNYKNVVIIYSLKEQTCSLQRALSAVTPPKQLGAVAICHVLNFDNTLSWRVEMC